jgi:hypothetical protein
VCAKAPAQTLPGSPIPMRHPRNAHVATHNGESLRRKGNRPPERSQVRCSSANRKSCSGKGMMLFSLFEPRYILLLSGLGRRAGANATRQAGSHGPVKRPRAAALQVTSPVALGHPSNPDLGTRVWIHHQAPRLPEPGPKAPGEMAQGAAGSFGNSYRPPGPPHGSGPGWLRSFRHPGPPRSR